ncbi:helix-turn-helix domain-containing protein [Facilibium subflavum]|uniref:helix-turn-helix domain-containing protein n=1 Tax=Facilibium subflavum TaxID=2219058 RepID=UPI000E64AA28|nr:helix-turn-helix transcriptional regulator [Facilibium subflavum]
MSKEKLLTLADRLNYIIEKLNIRMVDLAAAANTTPQNINFIRKNNVKSSKFTFDIANALGVNPEWLATGEGAIFIADKPEEVFLTNHALVPILSHNEIINTYIHHKSLESVEQYAAFAKNLNIAFAIMQPDASMAPEIPAYSMVGITEVTSAPIEGQIYLIYHDEIKALMLRRYQGSHFISNQPNFYKEIKMKNKVFIIGIAKTIVYNLLHPLTANS